MRVSVDVNDPGFAAFKRLGGFGRIKVLLNGQALRRCITADSKTGWATVYEEDDQGRPIFNSKRNAARRKRVRGKIEITVKRYAT